MVDNSHKYFSDFSPVNTSLDKLVILLLANILQQHSKNFYFLT